MNWFTKIFQPKSEKKDFSFTSSPIFAGNSTIENLATEGYCLNPSVYSAVTKIINAITQMELYVADVNDEEETPIENDLSKLLLNPDENQGQADWLAEYFSYYLIYGNSLIYRIATENGLNQGKAQQLKVLSQREVQIVTKQTAIGEIVDYYRFTNMLGGAQNLNSIIDKKDLFHGKTFNPLNQALGLSPLMAGGLSVDLDNSAKRWNVALLQNGVVPSGVYETDKALTEEQFQRMRRQFDQQSGPQNAGKQKIVEGGLKFKQTSLSSKDSDFHLGQLLSKREVSSIYNIAPQLIGDTESQTFANFEQAILSLHNDTAYPLLCALVGQLNNWLVPAFGPNLVIKIDKQNVDALQSQKKDSWTKIDESKELTINEKRELKGFDPVPNGDVIIIDGKTLDQIIQGQPTQVMPKSGTKSETSILTKDIYFDMQQKAMTENEDLAIEKSKEVVNKYFKNQHAEIEKSISQLHDSGQIMPAVNAVITRTTPELKKVYDNIYKDICLEHALKARKKYKTEALTLLRQHKETPKKPPASFLILENFKTEFDNYVDNYFNKIAIGELIQNVNQTTIDMVHDTVIEGVKNGDSIFNIAKSIQDQYNSEMTMGRADRIARTETLRGMSFAQHEAQKKQNKNTKQEWIDSEDDRVRTPNKYNHFDHASAGFANGKVGLNQGFKVSGEHLLFPRDTSLGASAGNVINCRCAVGFIDEEYEEFFND